MHGTVGGKIKKKKNEYHNFVFHYDFSNNDTKLIFFKTLILLDKMNVYR